MQEMLNQETKKITQEKGRQKTLITNTLGRDNCGSIKNNTVPGL